MNKTQKIVLSLITISTLALPIMTLAEGTNPTNVNITDITSLVGKIENFIWIVFGGIAVICFVIAGILFLTAQGAPEKVQTARSTFMWGIAGVVVAIVAYSIIAIISAVLR